MREDAPKSGADEDGSKLKSEEASDKADQPADKAEVKAEEKPSRKQSRRNHKDRRDAERAEGPSSKADARRERREPPSRVLTRMVPSSKARRRPIRPTNLRIRPR